MKYRIYRMEAGHIAGRATVINAADDEQAIQQAKRMLDVLDLDVVGRPLRRRRSPGRRW
jgi:hypothetical protein